MTTLTENPTDVLTDETIKAREDAHARMRKAFGALTEAYGTEHDALHAFVYAFDPTTRVRSLNKVVSDGADLGQPSTVLVHLGGYEYQLIRDRVGKPETTIVAPAIDVYDINGRKFGTDGYGVKRKRGNDDATVTPTATNMDAALDRVASNVGRMGLRIAEAANIVHVPDSDTSAPRKPRTASTTNAELATIRAEMAADRELLQQLLAKLTN